MIALDNRRYESVGKHIICDPDKCTGCQLCMYACSFRYTSTFSPLKSMINVVNFHPLLNIAVACQHCKDADCVRVCPVRALSQSAEKGLIIVDQEKCTGCGWCVEACAYGAMKLDVNKVISFTCDLCDGEREPLCMKWCPTEALERGDLENFRGKIKAYIEKHALSEYPEIKRWINADE